MQTDKVLEYLGKEVLRKTKKSQQKEKVLIEVDKLKKGHLNNEAELKCLLESCKIKQQESNDTTIFVLTFITTVVTAIAIIVAFFASNIMQGCNELVMFAVLFVIIMVVEGVVGIILCRIIEFKKVNLYNKMIAIEILLAEKQEKESKR